MNIYQQIIEEADRLQPQLQSMRRSLHQYPETGWMEVRTTSLIAQRLVDLGYTTIMTGHEVCKAEERMGLPTQAELDAHYENALAHGAVLPWAGRAKDGFTGVIAALDCGPGPIIGMRFDIDALGVCEDISDAHLPTREGFCSTQSGTMHACGHDGHAAIGLGVAEVLMKLKPQLHGKIKLIFQPAEEGVRGAKSIVANGHVDDVDFLLGNHIWAWEQPGTQVGVTTGPTLATTKLNVTFSGKACHAAYPDSGDNAMLAAATAILNLQAIPRCADGSTRVNVGTIYGGTGRNVICDRVKLEMEVRGAATSLNDYMETYARRILENAAAMHNCTCEIETMGSCGSVVNDPELVNRCCEVCREKLSLKVQPPTSKASFSEDYACLADAVTAHGGESLFFFTLSEMPAPNHAARFDFSESVLSTGVKIFCALAADRMGL